MRIFAMLVLAFSLSGCASYKALNTNFENPITRQTLYNLENTGVIAFAGLNAYRRSCIQGLIPASCKGVLRRVQEKTRKLPPLLASLRVFVKNNDQVNARLFFASVMTVLTEVKAITTANNIQVQ